MYCKWDRSFSRGLVVSKHINFTHRFSRCLLHLTNIFTPWPGSQRGSNGIFNRIFHPCHTLLRLYSPLTLTETRYDTELDFTNSCRRKISVLGTASSHITFNSISWLLNYATPRNYGTASTFLKIYNPAELVTAIWKLQTVVELQLGYNPLVKQRDPL